MGLSVAAATAGAQQPWLSLSPIQGDFYFANRTKLEETKSEAALIPGVPAAQPTRFPADIDTCKFGPSLIGAKKAGTVAIVGTEIQRDKDAAEKVRQLAIKSGLKIVFEATYPERTLDFAKILTSISINGPELVFNCNGHQAPFTMQMGILGKDKRR